MKNFKIKVLGIFTCLVASSFFSLQRVQAEEVLSQTFPGPVFYFDTSTRTKYLFSNGNFYSAKNPSAGQVWASTGLSTTLLDGHDYAGFTTGSGLAFGDFSYMGLETWDADSGWKNQIWRLGKRDGNLIFELSFNHPKPNALRGFVEFFTVKDAIFGVTRKGQVWKSKDGETWNKLYTYHFPKDPHTSDYIAQTVGSKVYLSFRGEDLEQLEAAYSTDGKHWTKEVKRFADLDTSNHFNTSGVKDFAYYRNYVYALIQDGQGVDTIWKKSYLNNDDQWTNLGPQSRDLEFIESDGIDYQLHLVSETSDYACAGISDCSVIEALSLDSEKTFNSVIRINKKAGVVYLIEGPDGYYFAR